MIATGEVIAIAIESFDVVIQRLSRDRAFRVKYCENPDSTLEGYFTPEEIRAIKTGDGHRLGELGAGDKWEGLLKALCGPHPGP